MEERERRRWGEKGETSVDDDDGDLTMEIDDRVWMRGRGLIPTTKRHIHLQSHTQS